MTSPKQKSVHQMLYEFDRLFRGLWDLNRIDLAKINRIRTTTAGYTLQQLFDLLIIPLTVEKVIEIAAWYRIMEEHENHPVHVTKIEREVVLAKIKKPMYANKRALIKKLRNYYVK